MVIEKCALGTLKQGITTSLCYGFMGFECFFPHLNFYLYYKKKSISSLSIEPERNKRFVDCPIWETLKPLPIC
jgi:hypothetical protein